jgi:hypothetical protein
MTIDNPGTIDGLGFDPETGKLVLRIYDHLEWSDAMEHLNLIVAKVNNYMTFLQSGQAREADPARPAEAFENPLISIAFRVPPTQEALEGLGLLAGQLRGAGVSFGYTTGDDATESYVFG